MTISTLSSRDRLLPRQLFCSSYAQAGMPCYSLTQHSSLAQNPPASATARGAAHTPGSLSPSPRPPLAGAAQPRCPSGVPTNPAGFNHDRDGSAACCPRQHRHSLVPKPRTEGTLLPRSGQRWPRWSRARGYRRADPGVEGSFRAAPDHFSLGTWGPDEVCSCLSFFTIGVGGQPHSSSAQTRPRIPLPGNRSPPQAGALCSPSFLLSLSICLSLSRPSWDLPVPTSFSPSPI